MEEKMSRWGVGPIFTVLSVGYGMVTLAINRYFHPIFQIGFLPNWFLSVLGIVLIVNIRRKSRVSCLLVG
jgi:hypothetical protein